MISYEDPRFLKLLRQFGEALTATRTCAMTDWNKQILSTRMMFLIHDYFDVRVSKRWSEDELTRLGVVVTPLTAPIIWGILPLKDEVDDLYILEMRSAIEYICEDFPHMCADIKDSKEFQELDDIIDNMQTQMDLETYARFESIKRQYRHVPSHPWWDMRDLMLAVHGVDFRPENEQHENQPADHNGNNTRHHQRT